MFFHFLVLLFVPGFAISEFLSLYKREDSLSLKLAFVVGMSIAVSTAVFGLWNTFIGPITQQIVGAYTVASLLAVAFVISGSIFRERPPRLWGSPKPSDYFVISLGILVMFIFGLLIFGKYPIFPAYPTTDYVQHTKLALQALSSGTSLSQALLYYGAEYQLAIALLGSTAPPIVVAREAMMIITVLSTLLVYGLAEKAFKSRGVGVIAVAIYLLGFIWVNIVYNSGTYSNFIGIMLSMFALTFFMSLGEWGKVRGGLAFTIMIIGLAFSHQTSLFVIPVFFVIAYHKSLSVRFTNTKVQLDLKPDGIRILVWLISSFIISAKTKIQTQLKDGWKTHLIPAIILITGMAVMAYLVRNSTLVFLSSILSEGQPLAPTTSLGYIFPRSSMITVFGDDFAFITLFMFSLVGIGFVLKTRKGASILTWLAFSFMVSLFSSDWRFAYVFMPPALLLSAFGMHSLLTMHFSDRMAGVRMKEDKQWTIVWASVIILILFITGSRSMILLTDVTSYQSLAQDQRSVYNAIIWSGSNLANTTVVSNTWQYSVYFDTSTQSHRGVTALYFQIGTTADMDYLARKGYRHYAMTNVTINAETLAYLNASGTFKQIWTDGLTKVYTYSVNTNASGRDV